MTKQRLFGFGKEYGDRSRGKAITPPRLPRARLLFFSRHASAQTMLLVHSSRIHSSILRVNRESRRRLFTASVLAIANSRLRSPLESSLSWPLETDTWQN